MQKITSAESVGHAAFAEGCTRDELLIATQTAASAVILIAQDAPTHAAKMRMLRAMTAILASSLLHCEPAAAIPDQADRWQDHRSEQKHRRRTLVAWTCFIAACAVATVIVWKISGRAI